MAQVTINTEKWLILKAGEHISYVYNFLGQITTYNNDFWTIEEFVTEQEWLDRLDELGVVMDNPSNNILN